ncbi:MYXO-CTERM sorting domain-containing protein [Nannocystis sp. ILAH1]|uniref:MYXO-CTERM sorting domain-containing protein n=1 Tax=Nannocystis sp. ILAH1 TaxID=2996789 RepID=UPI0022700DCD|nr:MYXO-CTERM sorting domain-containing protein [Nannocystis sp. ILAH1]MCY0989046.1 MYXO-CTERM sorting domain-containing protein [Nannocystis sp. ILAH1]
MALFGSRPAVLVLVLATCFGAREVAACLDIGDPCADVATWTMVQSTAESQKVPLDGIFLMRVSGPALAPVPLDVMTVEVTLDGVVVDGALEQTGIGGLLGWRPAGLLQADRTYVVAGTIHNLDAMPGNPGCGLEFEPFEFEVSTGSETMPPLVAPEVSREETVEFAEKLALDNLVCCDGAFPLTFPGCGSGGNTVDFTEGHCVPMQYTGRLSVELAGLVPGAGDGASMVSAARMIGDVVVDEMLVTNSFKFRTREAGPFCDRVVLRNLVTGATAAAPELCHGDGLVDRLGAQTLTPESPELAVCVGAPYVCEIDELGDSWDPDRCTQWPASEEDTDGPEEPTTGSPTSGGSTSGPGESGSGTAGSTADDGATTNPADGLVEHGCACASGEAAGGAWLAALMLLVRRRRTRA